MAGYDIGMSGIRAAQKALNVIGNNLANAATPGYHRQEVDLRPAEDSYMSGVMTGQGVDFAGIQRQIDAFLEAQLLQYNSSLSAMSRKLDALRVVESGMGELSLSSISESLDNFYASLSDLSLRPQDVNYQTSVTASAETLTSQLRNLASIVHSLQDSLYTEAQEVVDKVNQLAVQVAKMNQEIFSLQVQGQECGNLMDQRDLLIGQMGEYIDIRTVQRDCGVVDVAVSDIPIVIGSNVCAIRLGLTEEGGQTKLGIAAEGTEQLDTELQNGTLGAICELRNSTLADFLDKLDKLAVSLISEINRLHVQGISSNGSFTSLTGWTMTESSVADFVPPVTAGTIYVRVIDPDGVSTRYAVSVDETSTLESVAADLASIPGLDGATGLYAGRLQIVANTGYQFDFLPGVLTSPTTTIPSELAGAGSAENQKPPTIAISGQYTGTANQTYTCTVHTNPPDQTLAIGNGTMSLEVKDGSGAVVATLQLGSDYVPGTALSIEEGVFITLGTNGISPGYLNDGDVITIEALANSDTSGFLAAVGINCFFSGCDAASIDVTEDIRLDASRIAVSTGVEGTDNRNCVAMASLGDCKMAALGGMTTKEYYQQLAVEVGQKISVLDMQSSNTEEIIRSLEEQRDEASSVDVNEQASLMIVYERMFQAMAKYLNSVNDSIDTIMSMLS
ncbi:MAG TPA: flagellar hook-associated protein FlgK [Anaerohalosphaeraceae bacterium]|nr:flagellar hook-associated protein FlgK [Anaerohalosphaeraceae bacterium]HQG04675.1 flagellar hook-associated protein FlgK [Anaerohalosphaeraceae bacterium]HQI06495.1 flagellar hook-associated protein FlgK [Anaerohalosphaeraceae bacterium]HQJ66770.1 flagellar hook-associated protein FlgK [Anaerohalosphaeraceae bacterium]